MQEKLKTAGKNEDFNLIYNVSGAVKGFSGE